MSQYMTSGNDSVHGEMILCQYAKNVTSQFGEDGIIEEIFRRICPQNKSCIEFGAWDGKHLSNTYRLWSEEGWRALLIEGHPNRFKELSQTTSGHTMVTAINTYVAPTGENSLEAIIGRSGFPTELDLLCIDIDGDDYHILCSLKDLRPRVMLVEYNPTIPPHVDLCQMPGGAIGSSALAIVRAASSRGYVLACLTDSNCVFVRSDEFQKLSMPAADLVESFPRRYLSYVISDYRGDCYLSSQPIYAPKFPHFGLHALVGEWWRWRSTKRGAKSDTQTAPRLMPVRLFSKQDT